MLTSQYLQLLDAHELVRIAHLELDPLTCTPFEAALLHHLEAAQANIDLNALMCALDVEPSAVKQLLEAVPGSVEDAAQLLKTLKINGLEDPQSLTDFFTKAERLTDAAEAFAACY